MHCLFLKSILPMQTSLLGAEKYSHLLIIYRQYCSRARDVRYQSVVRCFNLPIKWNHPEDNE